MVNKKVGCLPVVKDEKIVSQLSETDVLREVIDTGNSSGTWIQSNSGDKEDLWKTFLIDIRLRPRPTRMV